MSEEENLMLPVVLRLIPTQDGRKRENVRVTVQESERAKDGGRE